MEHIVIVGEAIGLYAAHLTRAPWIMEPGMLETSVLIFHMIAIWNFMDIAMVNDHVLWQYIIVDYVMLPRAHTHTQDFYSNAFSGNENMARKVLSEGLNKSVCADLTSLIWTQRFCAKKKEQPTATAGCSHTDNGNSGRSYPTKRILTMKHRFPSPYKTGYGPPGPW